MARSILEMVDMVCVMWRFDDLLEGCFELTVSTYISWPAPLSPHHMFVSSTTPFSSYLLYYFLKLDWFRSLPYCPSALVSTKTVAKMKLLTTTAVLALATSVLAIPNDELQKRATCTIFGFRYPCTSTAGTPTSTTTSRASSTPPTTSATPTSPPSSGGRSAYTSGSTASDIDNNTGCTALTVIFARGTSEGGNIGSIAGPPMFRQLLSDLGASSLTLQGVNYPANSAGNVNCGAAGGAQMAAEVNTILARCPNTKIALSGYSQGACVVHNAASSQSLDNSQIDAVVLFGKFALCISVPSPLDGHDTDVSD